MKDIILSVIVPVYNSGPYLAKCIESILVQTFSELEIILVDDGSTDESGKICDEYVNKYKNIKCIHKKNEGACYARLAGIYIAKGEYVGFVDSDDWIEAEMYEVLMQEILDSKADIITSGFVFENGNTLTDLLPEGIYKGDECNKVYKNMIYEPEVLRSGMICSVCTKVYKKNIMKQYLEQVPQGLLVWEDLSYVYLPFLDAKCIRITHHTFYHYMQNENSTSHSYDLSLFSNTVYAFQTAFKMYCQCKELVTIQIEQVCLHCLIVLLIEEMESRSNGTSRKQYFQHIKEIGDNEIWEELYTKLEGKRAQIPLNEKRICIDLIRGRTVLVFLKLRARKNWRRVKWIMIKIHRRVMRDERM